MSYPMVTHLKFSIAALALVFFVGAAGVTVMVFDLEKKGLVAASGWVKAF